MLGQDLFQERPQRRDVPLAVAQRVEQPPLRFLAVGLERFVEGAAGGDDAQVLIQHQQGLAHGVDDGLSQRPAVFDCCEWSDVWSSEATPWTPYGLLRSEAVR